MKTSKGLAGAVHWPVRHHRAKEEGSRLRTSIRWEGPVGMSHIRQAAIQGATEVAEVPEVPVVHVNDIETGVRDEAQNNELVHGIMSAMVLVTPFWVLVSYVAYRMTG